MIAINLLPQPRRAAAARRRRIIRWGIAGCCLAMVLVGVCIACWLPFESGAGPLRAQLGEVRTVAERAEADMLAIDAELQAAQARLRAVHRVTAHPDWSVLLDIVSRAREGGVVLDLCELGAAAAPQDLVLRLGGIAQEQREVPGFVLRLEATGLFSRVTLLESQARVLGSGAVFAFRIECALSGAGGATP